MEEKLHTSHQGALVAQKAKHILGYIKRMVADRLSEVIFSPLFCFDENQSGVLCPALLSSVQDRHGSDTLDPKEGLENHEGFLMQKD